jgi:hypothetical protein
MAKRLRQAEAAFAAGDYQTTRKLARSVNRELEQTEASGRESDADADGHEKLRKHAEELERRTTAEPLIRYLLAIAAALLLFLALFAYRKGHP